MNDLIEQVKSNGIGKKENWLSLADEEKARQIIKSMNAKKGDAKSWFSINFKSFLQGRASRDLPFLTFPLRFWAFQKIDPEISAKNVNFHGFFYKK